jgi:hypothetical protein
LLHGIYVKPALYRAGIGSRMLGVAIEAGYGEQNTQEA